MARENIIVGLDIGTTKIGCIIAELDGDLNAKIVGVGTSRSDGLRRGVVVNLEKTVVSIGRAIEEAELMAGVEVRNVFAGIAGDHIRSINSHGVIAVSRGGVEITRSDINREFIVDEQQGIKDPTGMAGTRLEVDVHIVTGAVSSAQNLVKAIQKAGYQVSDLVLEPLASSQGVLTQDEKDLGVALVDIGGGTTDIAVFNEGSIRHTSVIGLGGSSVTNDIAIGLRTPGREAERIKERFGAALTRMVDAGEDVVVPRVAGQGERRVSRRIIASIIQPRMEEILALVRNDIGKTRWYERIPSGVVLTGGASALPGTAELAEEALELPVRIGYPIHITGLVDSVNDPRFATGVGLVLYGRDKGRAEHQFAMGDDDSLWDRVFDRMKEWLQDFI
jgi:cell division protein FtsA